MTHHLHRKHLLRRLHKPALGRSEMEVEFTENLPPGPWTNEKHFHFLNTMEASFVRTMLQSNGVNESRQLRLDRYLPDSSESTLDLKSHRRDKAVESSSGLISVGPTGSRAEEGRVDRRRRRKRRRRTRSTPLFHKSPEDQVVPQLEDERDDRHGKM